MVSDSNSHASLRRIEGLLTTLVRLQTGPILEAQLKSDFERDLYALTGEKTHREIQRQLKVGPNRISDTWKRWERLGLVTRDGQSYRRTV